MKGLVVTDKSERVYYFHKNTLHAANELLAAAGKTSFADVDISIFMRGDEFAHDASRRKPGCGPNLRSERNESRVLAPRLDRARLTPAGAQLL